MAEFFRGWRRKLGVAVLVVACIVMAGWMRSLLIADAFYLFGSLILTSGSGSTAMVLDGPLEYEWPAWDTAKLSELSAEFDTLLWRFRWMGFGYAEGEYGDEISVWIIPYWSIAAPLALLSAYLILSRSRSTRPVPESADDNTSTMTMFDAT